MSIRQRVPFKFSDDGYAIDETGHILDEQGMAVEQEEVIQKLRDTSEKRNAQYALLLQALVALSVLLHCIFIVSPSKHSPLMVLYPPSSTTPSSSVLPLASLFALLHIFVHLNLSVQLLPPGQHIRQAFTSNSSGILPLSYPVLFGLASIAPVVAVMLRHTWLDISWWAAALLMTWIVYSGQDWVRQENEALSELEKLRYTARGA
ncbi:hypothetical protein PsYK624_146440 [Phanerochaete sordida]|uniref:Uncharacterized protein n=1 Tax=Phanerochaete sordida TaxID=48140 RepID=A0A9P3GQC2_9APHY|nr:hypothetical protein PsYK624_146440 [Phanerochaete sordida]